MNYYMYAVTIEGKVEYGAVRAASTDEAERCVREYHGTKTRLNNLQFRDVSTMRTCEVWPVFHGNPILR